MDDAHAPNSKPAFLDPKKATSIGYVGAPPDAVPLFDSEFDTESPEAPSRGIIDRYREVARRHAHGQTNNQICAALGYTPTRVSIILKDPFVQEEITKWRQAFFDSDAIERLKAAARDGAKRIHDLILNPATEDRVLLQAAQFAIEKSHGKAKQEVSVESGTLMSYMEMLRNSLGHGLPAVAGALPEATPRDVSEPDAAQVDPFDTWLDANLNK